MTTNKRVFLQEEDLILLKRRIGLALPGIAHSKAIDVLARTLGFKSYGALRASLRNIAGTTDERPDPQRMQDAIDAGRMACGREAERDDALAAEAAITSALEPFEALAPSEGGKAPIGLVAGTMAGIDLESDEPVTQEAPVGFHGRYRPVGYVSAPPKSGGDGGARHLILHVNSERPAEPYEILDAIRYCERVAMRRRAMIVVTSEDGGLSGEPGSLKSVLSKRGYADVSGTWWDGAAWKRTMGSGDGIIPYRGPRAVPEARAGNPGLPIRIGNRPGADGTQPAREIARILIPAKGAGDSYFTDKARFALAGLVEALAAKVGIARDYGGIPRAWHGCDPSMPMLADWIALQHATAGGASGDPIADWLATLAGEADPRLAGTWSSEAAWIEAKALLAMAPKERHGVLGTVDQALVPYKDARVRQAALEAARRPEPTARQADMASILRPILSWQAIEEVREIAVNKPGEVWLRLRRPDEEGKVWLRREDRALSGGYLRSAIMALAVDMGIPNYGPGGEQVCYGILPGGYHFVADLGGNLRSGAGEEAIAFCSRRPGGEPRARPEPAFPQNAGERWFPGAIESFVASVRPGESILIAAATERERTGMLNKIGAMISHEARIVTLEHSQAIEVAQRNVLRIAAGGPRGKGPPGADPVTDLIVRASPDAVLVGEVTAGNARLAWELMRSGEYPVIATIGADSTADAIRKLARRAGYKDPASRDGRERIAGEIPTRVRTIHVSADEDGSSLGIATD